MHVRCSDTQCWRREEQAEASLLPVVDRSLQSLVRLWVLVPGHLDTLTHLGWGTEGHSLGLGNALHSRRAPHVFFPAQWCPQALASSSTSLLSLLSRITPPTPMSVFYATLPSLSWEICGQVLPIRYLPGKCHLSLTVRSGLFHALQVPVIVLSSGQSLAHTNASHGTADNQAEKLA